MWKCVAEISTFILSPNSDNMSFSWVYMHILVTYPYNKPCTSQYYNNEFAITSLKLGLLTKE